MKHAASVRPEPGSNSPLYVIKLFVSWPESTLDLSHTKFSKILLNTAEKLTYAFYPLQTLLIKGAEKSKWNLLLIY